MHQPQITYTDQKDNPCLVWDEYLENNREHLILWVAKLNNGQTAYQDDDRPERKESSWLSLKKYCETNNFYIVDFRISFRNCHHHLPSNADGYYFIKGAGCIWGYDKTFSYYIVGTVKDNIILVDKIKVPELYIEESEIRQIEENKECLILKPLNLLK